MLLLLFTLSYIIGGYQSDVITKETEEFVKYITPKVEDYLSIKGFNGYFRPGPPVEIMTKVVHGVYHAIRTESDGKSFCIVAFEDDNDVDVVEAKPCDTLLDVIHE